MKAPTFRHLPVPPACGCKAARGSSSRRGMGEVLSEGRPSGSQRLQALHGAGGGNGLDRRRKRAKLASSRASRKASGDDGRSDSESIKNSLPRPAEEAPRNRRGRFAEASTRVVKRASPRPHASAGPSLPVHGSRPESGNASTAARRLAVPPSPRGERRAQALSKNWERTMGRVLVVESSGE